LAIALRLAGESFSALDLPTEFAKCHRSRTLAKIRIRQRLPVQAFADGVFDNISGDCREVVIFA